MESHAQDSLLLVLEERDGQDQDSVLDWEDVFGNPGPVEIEIGIGKGRFLIDAAQKHPQVNFLGLEWAAKYLRIAHARSLKSNLQNIRLVRADAQEFLEFFVASISVQAIHLYFPDPWPKKRHHKRRLFNQHFLREVERILKPGGRLWLATDHGEYFQVMLGLLEGSSWLREVEAEWPGVKTNYEDKYITQGKTIHRRVVEKHAAEEHGPE